MRCLMHGLSVIFATAASAGPPVVEISNFTIQSQSIAFGSKGWIVTIGGVADPGPSGSIWVEAVDGDTPIEEVVITPGLNVWYPTTQNISLTIRPRPNTTGYVSYLGGVRRSGTQADLWINSISVDGSIGDSDFVGQNSIVAQSINIVTAEEIFCAIASQGSSQVAGNIASVVATNGPILGSIVANSIIGEVVAEGGDIGLPDALVSITATSGIGRVAGQAVYANIRANQGGVGALARLTTSAGPFKGSLTTQYLHGTVPQDGILVNGVLDATVNIYGNCEDSIRADGLAPGKQIVIGGFLTDEDAADGSITLHGPMQGTIQIRNGLEGNIALPAGGLVGQIVLNRNNAGAAWERNVTVGSIIIGPTRPSPDTAPHYTRPSQPNLGGGAIGQAPFQFYEEDCVPPAGGYKLLSSFSDISPVFMSFYGPLAVANPSLPIASIEYHRAYRPYTDGIDNWAPADSLFLITIDENNPRRLKIVPDGSKPKIPGEYRVRTTSNLRNANVTGSPQIPISDYSFWLALNCNGVNGADAGDFLSPVGGCNVLVDCDCNLISDCCDIALGGRPGEGCNLDDGLCEGTCDCDFNHSGQINSQDFFDFMACFFGSPCPPGEDADYNNDSVVNSQDFFDFLACFFSAC